MGAAAAWAGGRARQELGRAVGQPGMGGTGLVAWGRWAAHRLGRPSAPSDIYTLSRPGCRLLHLNIFWADVLYAN